MDSNHLNIGLVWYSIGRLVSGCQMVQYSNGGLKARMNQICLWSKMSGNQKVGQVTWLYHMNTGHPYCLLFGCLLYSKYLNSGCQNTWFIRICTGFFSVWHSNGWIIQFPDTMVLFRTNLCYLGPNYEQPLEFQTPVRFLNGHMTKRLV